MITGGAQGIGRALAEELLRNQYKVCILDMNKDAGEKAQTELNKAFGDGSIFFFACDVTKNSDLESAVKLCIESLGRIDVFVNNAGIVNEYNPSLTVSVNLTAVIQACGIVTEHMRKDKGGSGGTIINVSSIAGLVSLPFIPIYCATKSGVLSYTKAVAKQAEIAAQGITLSCICPGFTDTAFVHNLEDKIPDFSTAHKAIEHTGLLKVKAVTDGILKLIKDQKNGSILKVSANGTDYVPE